MRRQEPLIPTGCCLRRAPTDAWNELRDAPSWISRSSCFPRGTISAMPLSAFVNGQRTIAALLGVNEWNSLKGSRPIIELCCCKTKGFMRVSKLGTQHFVHVNRADACSSGLESAEHLLFKGIAAKAVQEAGWEADVEVCDSDGRWRADVMAVRNSRRVAFEIQLSPISLAELQRRQAAYASSNIRGCWFYGPRVFGARPPVDSAEPLFPIGNSGNVGIASRAMSLREGVISLLNGHFRRCATQRISTIQDVNIYRFSMCWACHRGFDIYSIVERRATCGNVPSIEEEGEGEPLPLNKSGAPWVVERVQRYVNAHSRMSFELSFPGWCEATSSGRKHYTFCCYHCGALIAEEIFDQLLVSDECSQDISYGLQRIAAFRLSQRASIVDRPHWCFSTSHRFCSSAVE